MKIVGRILTEVDVTLYDMIKALGNEMVNLVNANPLHNPQLLRTEIVEENDGSMWVREHRFNGNEYYPVPEKEQELVKAIKKLQVAYEAYISQ